MLRWMLAISADALQKPVQQFKNEFLLALLLLGFGLAIAALVQVLIGIKPLKNLQADLLKIRQNSAGNSSQNSTEFLSNNYPSEVAPLVQEFNLVLQQNAQNIERARTQAGNLAHGLKTPLAVLQNAANQQDKKLANLVLEQVEIAKNQVNYHLNRARATAMRNPHASCQILLAAEGLLRVLQRIYADKNLQFELQISPELQFKGEQSELEEMLGNLLDNACKWAQNQVKISAEIAAKQLQITIEDDGPGLVAEQKFEVLQRGVRTDERTQGTGLGLNIVENLVADYGGKIELADSKLGGLAVILKFGGF